MPLVLYNTLSRKKEVFTPNQEGKVSMYVCGPTTYDYIHVGNARALVVFDTIRRYLKYKGYEVTYVQNFTDIDDKIIKRAKEERIFPLTLSQKYICQYFKDAGDLNIIPADYHPLVTQHITEVIELIQKILKNGHAYIVEGDVYFKVNSFSRYGILSGRTKEELRAGARVEIDERKENPLDFALWKKAKEGEPFWESPWGKGRPGWHIECSAMALYYLGSNFDIHGGGCDLIFPHHENELAQAEAAGFSFARYWLHNGFITINKEKMSKSLGNFFLVRDVLKLYEPMVLRYYLISTHYRSPLDFDEQNLLAAQKGWERVQLTYKFLKEYVSSKEADILSSEIKTVVEETGVNFEKAMDDDFNTALALASIHELLHKVNYFLDKKILSSAEQKLLLDFLEEKVGLILGLDLKTKKKANEEEMSLDMVTNLLLDIREKMRAEKRWDLADEIRDKLEKIGIVVEDTIQGPRWRQK